MSKPKVEISEHDKPFILALIASVIFIIIIVIGCIGAYIKNNDLIEFAKWAGALDYGLMNMAWTYYLVKKERN